MIPQNREKVKSRSSFVHIKQPQNPAFSRGFWPFTICSRFRFCTFKTRRCVQGNAQTRMQFEQKVKNAEKKFKGLQFVQKINHIIYILSLFNLLFSQNLHPLFAFLTPYSTTRSSDCHVHLAQFQASIFYVCANCTNF